MIRSLILILITSLWGCSDPSAVIHGTWQIDTNATVAMANAQNALWLRDHLGQLTDGLIISFHKDGRALVQDGVRHRESRYSVLDHDENGMMLSLRSAQRTHRIAVVVRDGRMVLAENKQTMVLLKK